MKPSSSKRYKNDVFEKAYLFTKADELKSQGLFPFFKPLQSMTGNRVVMEGKEVVMAGSNNYLGLTSDQRIIDAAKKAAAQYGTGCTSAYMHTGTLAIHKELEEKLATFMQKEACVLFSTGYLTNSETISTITAPDDVIFSDKENHASIVTGLQSSSAQIKRFLHNDMQKLEAILELEDNDAGKLIISDGVFSMTGKLANIPELLRLAKRYGARLYLDDAHAVGVIGEGGRGSASFFSLLDEVDLVSGTFSKSFASLGGFVVGPQQVIEYIRQNAPVQSSSASMPPSNTAAVLKSLEILQQEPWRLDRLKEITHYMTTELKNMGFYVFDTDTPIVSVLIGEMTDCFRFCNDLYDLGVFANAVAPPAVPLNQSLIRSSYMATHTNEDLDLILEAFRKAGLKNGIIEQNGHSSIDHPDMH